MYRPIVLALISVVWVPRGLSAQFDWPQWQGPDRTAHSKETGLLKEWPKEGPALAWKVKGLGGGDSTPSVAGGRVYGMSHRGADEIVWALSEKDGQEVWAVRIAAAQPQNWPQSKEGPSATPTVDGNRLYVLGLAGNVACLQAADGRIYFRTEEGPMVLIEPSRREYVERGRFTQPERTDKPAWAHPVIANGKLYIRDQDTLFCYDVKAK